jgi:hypothetical protein
VPGIAAASIMVIGTLMLCPGLMIRRTLAQKIAGTQDLESDGYKKAFRAQMLQDNLYDASTKSQTLKVTFTAILWLQSPEHKAALAEIRSSMTPGQLARLNSPITARQKVERKLGITTVKPKPVKEPTDPDALAERNKELVEELASEKALRADDASVFDVTAGTVQSVARTIVGQVSPDRARKIARAILAEIGEAWRVQPEPTPPKGGKAKPKSTGKAKGNGRVLRIPGLRIVPQQDAVEGKEVSPEAPAALLVWADGHAEAADGEYVIFHDDRARGRRGCRSVSHRGYWR